MRWVEEMRPHLFASLTFTRVPQALRDRGWIRLDSAGLAQLFAALVARDGTLGDPTARGEFALRFKATALYYVSTFVHDPPSLDAAGVCIAQTEVTQLNYGSAPCRNRACALSLTKLALLCWASTGDDFHVTASGLASTPLAPKWFDGASAARLDDLARRILTTMQQHVIFTRYAGKTMGNYDVKLLRPLTDQVDQLVLDHLGLASRLDDVELAYARFMKMTGERPGTWRGVAVTDDRVQEC